MKILAPTNNPKEAERIIEAGADELYCGVLPEDWKGEYTNAASCNRREWKTANLSSFDQLKEVVDIAHSKGVFVYLVLNALYTKGQHPYLFKQVERATKIGVDALIVADLGFLLTLKKEKAGLDIHISTGGTTFNSQTAKFYEDFGISRINLPRHLQIQEMAEIIKDCPSIKFDCFILNSGCKNIDGFCTFQHGVNEILHKQVWDIPKKLNLDRYLLDTVRRLPMRLAERIKGDLFGIDSACLLNYDISFMSDSKGLDKRGKKSILNNISRSFSLLSGVDTCGVCRLAELKKIGVYGVKIVGRNYSASKKVKDVRFLKKALSYIEEKDPELEEFYNYVKDAFRQAYGMDCRRLCYYPDGM